MIHGPTSDQTNERSDHFPGGVQRSSGSLDFSYRARIGESKGSGCVSSDHGQAHHLADDEIEAILAARTLWLHCVPLSHTFNGSRRVDKVFRTDTQPAGFGDQQSEDANRLVARMVALTEQHISLNLYFSIENPLGSFIWYLKPLTHSRRSSAVRVVREHRCVHDSQHEKETGVLTNATRIRTPEYPRHTCNVWVKNWVEWLASTDLWQTAGRGHRLRRGAMVPSKTAAFTGHPGELRDVSRKCSVHKPLGELGARMRRKRRSQSECKTRHH